MTEITETKEVSLAGIKPLTVKEADRLEQLEKYIHDNFKGFYTVGCALKEIRDSQLYREKFKTFEEYCKDVWETGRRTAYQYIAAVDAYENVRHGAQNENLPEPSNERQIRHLTRKELSPEDQITCWKKACEKAAEAGRDVTAFYVEQAVVEFLGGRTERNLTNKKKEITKLAAGIELQRALSNVFQLLQECRKAKWRGVNRAEMLSLLDDLTLIVRSGL